MQMIFSEHTILKRLCDQHGLSETLVSANISQFTSKLFCAFCSSNLIMHCWYYPTICHLTTKWTVSGSIQTSSTKRKEGGSNSSRVRTLFPPFFLINSKWSSEKWIITSYSIHGSKTSYNFRRLMSST